MASKNKNSKVENEIERFRALQNWDRAIEITRTQWTKTANGIEVARDKQYQDVLTNLLQGEKQLEVYLRNNPPNEDNVEKARKELVNSEQSLRYVIQRSPKERESLKQEAVLLLGKLYFAQAKYTEALKAFDSINFNGLTLHSVTNRMLKIVAEGLAVKAMCMEKLSQEGKAPGVDTEMIIKYYEQAGDILLLHLQNRDTTEIVPSPTYPGQMTVGNSATLQDDSIGSILETAIQKSPLVYIEKGQISKGVGRFRQLLRAVGPANSKNLYRLTLARQLAEVLMRGICSSTYPRINLQNESKQSKGLFRAKHHDSPNMFVPSNEEEEAILLLLIAEGMANKEAVLERRPEHTQSRHHAYDNATAIYDLLAVALVRRSNCSLLAEALERALKFSYEEPHVWYQFALSLIETGKFDRGFLVLKECHRLKPADPTILLLQAKLCFERLHQIDTGIQICEKATQMCEEDITKSKAYLLLATGYSQKMSECRVKSKRDELQQKALDAFTEAHKLDSYNNEATFHLALHLAQQRKLTEAITYTRQILEFQPDHMNALTLLSLIFSAEKKYEKGLEVIKIALGEHPDTLSLLLVKSRLESSLGLFHQSLTTCAQMLRLWKQEYQNVLDCEDQRGTGLLERFTATDNKTLLLITDTSQDTGGSLKESMDATRVERALSEVASSSPSVLWTRHGPQHSWSLQAQIWLHIAEIYVDNEYYQEAHGCVQEAMAIFPLSYLASYMKGRVLECENLYVEAKCHFEAALSINPYHVKSMTYLGKCLHMLGNYQSAEKTLRDAVNTDPTSHNAWRELGIVLETAGEFETAADCLMTSINLECSTPLLPFGILQRTV